MAVIVMENEKYKQSRKSNQCCLCSLKKYSWERHESIFSPPPAKSKRKTVGHAGFQKDKPEFKPLFNVSW